MFYTRTLAESERIGARIISYPSVLCWQPLFYMGLNVFNHMILQYNLKQSKIEIFYLIKCKGAYKFKENTMIYIA